MGHFNKKNIVVSFILSLIGAAFVINYIFSASTDVVASDYIRIINYYIDDVSDLKYLLSWEAISRIPFTFLARFINIKIFSYSVFFDKILGVVGLFIFNFITVKYILDNLNISFIKIAASIIVTFVSFSLMSWEMLLNGTGYAHFITIGLIALIYYIFSHIIVDTTSSVVGATSTIVGAKFQESSRSREFNERYSMLPYIIIIASSIICFALYYKSEHTGVPLVPVGFKNVSLIDVLKEDVLFPIRFLLKSLASSIIGTETFSYSLTFGVIDEKVVFAIGIVYLIIIFWTLFITIVLIKNINSQYIQNNKSKTNNINLNENNNRLDNEKIIEINKNINSENYTKINKLAYNGKNDETNNIINTNINKSSNIKNIIIVLILLIIITSLVFAGSYAVAFQGTLILFSLFFIILQLANKYHSKKSDIKQTKIEKQVNNTEQNYSDELIYKKSGINNYNLNICKTLFPVIYIIYGLINYVLVFLARFKFVDDTYGMSSRYAIQYMFLSIGIIIILSIYIDNYFSSLVVEDNIDNRRGEFHEPCVGAKLASPTEHTEKIITINKEKITLKNIITVLISLICIFILWFGNVTTSTDEIYKAHSRKIVYENLENVAKNYNDYSDEELMNSFEYFRGGDQIRNALEILQSQNLNVFKK